MVEYFKSLINSIQSIIILPNCIVITYPLPIYRLIYIMPVVPILRSSRLDVIWPGCSLYEICRHSICLVCNCKHDIISSFPDLFIHSFEFILGDLSHGHMSHAIPSFDLLREQEEKMCKYQCLDHHILFCV